MEVSKRDAANRQLNEAIHLFFEQRDPVAIHTLIGSASLILSDLVEANNPEKSWDKSAQQDNELDKKSYYKIMRKTQNFIKHANSDPDETLSFDVTEAPALAMFSILNNGELGGMLSREQPFFQLWYLAVHYKNLEWDGSDIPNALSMFGDLSKLTMKKQISHGKKVWEQCNAS